VDMYIPSDSTTDYAVGVEGSAKYGLAFVVTKTGVTGAFEIDSGSLIFMTRISEDTVFVTATSEESAGFTAINNAGQVFTVGVDDSTFFPFTYITFKSFDLAFKIASRSDTPGARSFFQEQFQRLMQERMYHDAIYLAANAPNNALRSISTIKSFQALPTVQGKEPFLLMYFNALLQKGSLTASEAVEWAKCVVAVDPPRVHSVKTLLDQHMVVPSSDLADVLKTVDEASAAYVEEAMQTLSQLRVDSPPISTPGMNTRSSRSQSVSSHNEAVLSIDEITWLWHNFCGADSCRCGTLSRDDWEVMLRKEHGVHFADDCVEYFDLFDPENEGYVQFFEYVRAVTVVKMKKGEASSSTSSSTSNGKRHLTWRDVRTAEHLFRNVDIDDKGMVAVSDVVDWMILTLPATQVEDSLKFIEALDQHGNGQIGFTEFLRAVTAGSVPLPTRGSFGSPRHGQGSNGNNAHSHHMGMPRRGPLLHHRVNGGLHIPSNSDTLARQRIIEQRKEKVRAALEAFHIRRTEGEMGHDSSTSSVPAEALADILKTLHPGISAPEINRLYHKLDTGRTGRVDVDQFLETLAGDFTILDLDDNDNINSLPSVVPEASEEGSPPPKHQTTSNDEDHHHDHHHHHHQQHQQQEEDDSPSLLSSLPNNSTNNRLIQQQQHQRPHRTTYLAGSEEFNKPARRRSPSKPHLNQRAVSPLVQDPPSPPHSQQSSSQRIQSHSHLPPRTSLLSRPVINYAWEIPLDELVLGTKLGEGTFGVVYKGTWRGTSVAIKKLKTQNLTNEIIEDFRNEIAILGKLRHPNVVLFMGAVTVPPELCMVTEYMDGGSLYDAMHKKKVRLNTHQILKIATQAARGLNYLHLCNPKIIHRDLKTLNFLVDGYWNVKLADFGLSCIKPTASSVQEQVGTPGFMAPELMLGKSYTEKVDVYSFGICLWEMVTGEFPFNDLSYDEMRHAVIFENRRPQVPSYCLLELAQLMEQCWQADETGRPTMASILDSLDQMTNDFWVPM